MTINTIKIGTRGSSLALWQANWVKSEIERKNPGLSAELVIIKTKGDKILNVTLSKVGGKGLFVKEIEDALLQGDIDIAVHSMKDMPAEIPYGLYIGAVPDRENPNDVLISKNHLGFSDLKEGACIGTSSLRRMAQLLRKRSDLKIVPLRGNINTRLKKLETENLDGIVLAAAGLLRMNMRDKITEYLDESFMLPAVGQGALCVETRNNDYKILPFVAKLDHGKTRRIITGERAFLKRIEGGCQVPIAAFGRIDEDIFSLTGLVADPDGKKMIKETLTGSTEMAETIGEKLADILLTLGAKQILDNLNEQKY